jgi:hypothetical protein
VYEGNMASTVSNRARIALILSILITVALYVLPWGHTIGYPLVLLSTIAHEVGHGIAALMMGGEFRSLQVFADASGVAHHAGNHGPLASAFISAGGLVGPSIVAAGLFGVGRYERLARPTLGMIGVFLLMLDLLVVRNTFGFLFIGAVGVVALGLASRASKGMAQVAVVFVATQLALSVYSRSDYLFTDVAQTGAGPMPSDVAHMADALFLPYWFWGGACGLFSMAVLGLGLLWFLRR